MTASARPLTDPVPSPPYEIPPIVVGTPRPLLGLVAVPDCHHVTQTACNTLLSAAGLGLGTVTIVSPQDSPPYIGSRVIAQNPAAGTIVRRGSLVNVYIQPFGAPGRP